MVINAASRVYMTQCHRTMAGEQAGRQADTPRGNLTGFGGDNNSFHPRRFCSLFFFHTLKKLDMGLEEAG